MIYLDNSATTYPKPPQVRQAVARALGELGGQPGPGRLPHEPAHRPGRVPLPQPGGGIFRRAGAGVRHLPAQLHPGTEPGAEGQPEAGGPRGGLRFGAQRGDAAPSPPFPPGGVTYTLAKTVPGDNDATLDAFRQAMGPRTRLVVCTPGLQRVRLPAAGESASPPLCHQYGAKAVCGRRPERPAWCPSTSSGDGIDYLCCAGHKGLYGPMGVGLLVLPGPGGRPSPPWWRVARAPSPGAWPQPEDSPERYRERHPERAGHRGPGGGPPVRPPPGAPGPLPEGAGPARPAAPAAGPGSPGWSCTPRGAPGPLFPAGAVLQPPGHGRARRWGSAWGRRGSPCGVACTAPPWPHQKLGTQQGTVRVSPSRPSPGREEIDALARQVGRLCRGGKF